MRDKHLDTLGYVPWAVRLPKREQTTHESQQGHQNRQGKKERLRDYSFGTMRPSASTGASWHDIGSQASIYIEQDNNSQLYSCDQGSKPSEDDGELRPSSPTGDSIYLHASTPTEDDNNSQSLTSAKQKRGRDDEVEPRTSPAEKKAKLEIETNPQARNELPYIKFQEAMNKLSEKRSTVRHHMNSIWRLTADTI